MKKLKKTWPRLSPKHMIRTYFWSGQLLTHLLRRVVSRVSESNSWTPLVSNLNLNPIPLSPSPSQSTSSLQNPTSLSDSHVFFLLISLLSPLLFQFAPPHGILRHHRFPRFRKRHHQHAGERLRRLHWPHSGNDARVSEKLKSKSKLAAATTPFSAE